MPIVGSDGVFVQAKNEGLIDAVISGVAGVLPELILSLSLSRAGDGAGQIADASLLLEELLQRLDSFPVPWGLKWIAERRGLQTAELPYPASRLRRQQCDSFQRWFDGCLSQAVHVLEMQESLV